MGKAKIRGQETRGRAIESWCLRLSELKQWKQSEIKDFTSFEMKNT